MSISGKPPKLLSYQNQFNNGIYVTKGPVVLPDNSVSAAAIANGDDGGTFVTVDTDQTVTGKKRFSEQITADDGLLIETNAANKRVLMSDGDGNATWQDLIDAENDWTNTNTFNGSSIFENAVYFKQNNPQPGKMVRCIDVYGTVELQPAIEESDNTWTGENQFDIPPTCSQDPWYDAQLARKHYVDLFGKLDTINTWVAGNQFDVIPTTSTDPTNSNQLARKSYVDLFGKKTGAQVWSGGQTFNNTVEVNGQTTINSGLDVTGALLFSNAPISNGILRSYNNADGYAYWTPPLESSANTWTGTNNFSVALPTSSITPTSSNDLCNKTYVDTSVVPLQGTFNITGSVALTSQFMDFVVCGLTDLKYIPYQKAIKLNAMNINWVNNTITSINLGSVGVISTSLTVTSTALTSFIASELVAVYGNLLITTNASTSQNLNKLVVVYGNLLLSQNASSSSLLTLQSLKAVLGTFTISNGGGSGFDFSLLTEVTGNITFNTNGIPSFIFPLMTTFAAVGINSSSLIVFDVPLATSFTSILLTANAMTTFNIPLVTSFGTFTFTANTLTTLTLTAVQSLGYFVIASTGMTTISMPAIVNLTGNSGGNSVLIVTGGAIVNFSLGSTLKSVTANFSLTGCPLNQASVDGILASLALLDGTNGTTAYSSKTITLNNVGASAPSAAGVTSKNILIARGCTVLTN